MPVICSDEPRFFRLMSAPATVFEAGPCAVVETMAPAKLPGEKNVVWARPMVNTLSWPSSGSPASRSRPAA